MKYLCLVYGEEKAIQSMDDRHCLAFDESIRKSGHCVASEALQPVASATTVRVRNGKVSVTDGPFAETKEALGGYYLIEAADLDEAIATAKQMEKIFVTLYNKGAADGMPPLEAPQVPIVYQLMKSVGHSTMALAQVVGPYLNNPADKSWRNRSFFAHFAVWNKSNLDLGPRHGQERGLALGC